VSTTFESFGKYVLLEKLATGGMAEVFLARGSGAGGIGKFFAVKRILPQYADSPEFIDMFKDEAKIAINLNHSNIVSIHEFGVEKGIFFLVMDYVEGRNLRQILNKMKKSSLQFSMDQIVYVAKEVAAGLDHAHRCIDGTTGKPLNITHRDMSPQNLMVSFEGEVKIVDFGIAKAESQLETTRAGTLKGKFGYMSPEQAEGQPVDLRTDIFSLGIVMWELLANDRLFVANNELNTLRKIRDCQIPSLRKINPNIHTELERIVQKALARDRNLRYQTAAALHRDLNRFLNRQYPDFSPQDFSVFTKSVFSDEILSLRKRLVEYSKVNINSSSSLRSTGDRNFDDRTSLLNTDTNSLVVSQTGADAGTSSEVVAEASITDQSPMVEHHTATEPPAENTEATDSHVTEPPVAENSVASFEMSQPTFNTDVPQGLPPTTRPHSPVSVLDEAALSAEMKRDITTPTRTKAPVQLETEDVSSPSIKSQTRTYSNRAIRQTSSSSSSSRRRKQAKPIQFATFFVFALLCVSVYAYLVKYFNPMMVDVIAVTDPYIHPFHVALNVDPHMTVSSSHNEPLPPPQPQIQPPPSQQPQFQAKTENLPDEDTSPNALLVITNPSGAEVIINDKNTGLVTPVRVEIPRGNFDITLQKPGFLPTKLHNTNKEQVGRRLVAALVKMNVAYLDIDVFPPQDAIIYINGKRLAQKGPIRQMPVAANTVLRIRAENKAGTVFDETELTLPVDRRQGVSLHPRRPLRVPSGSSGE